MLTVKNVKKTFYPGTPNEKRALNDVSLELDAGDFVTIIGSNGAGKSTLFNAIGGAFWVDAGSIHLDGKNITSWKDYKRAYDIGRVFQDTLKGTAPNLTIEENLALAYTRKAKKSLFAVSRDDRDFFRTLLEKLNLGLEDRLKAKVGQLSGGQRQAVSLLMCTIAEPKLLLLDEHTAALDPATAEKVLAITVELVEAGKITTMMITHDMQAALSIGNRTIMMDDGGIILDLSGKERADMTVDRLLTCYTEASKKKLANDRMLLR
ncbi:ATP-binding cassette domain-containing protein [Cuneatibacter sp. NSJ-177]|uniref:ABC transporter ATP-binding protein n=1 Tax=Cuneatibacter sp. NSJ-177 TaxID=2931401 RepID=UPI001FD43BAB|nr:ATP-binding cassette domain-containing protein [Cuneatibacter sp. NSJ-177]MCJ7836860.1 ATP-binding cassette domain-containing protein [Cuneatibacter sp. NSJ-177]